MIEKLAKLTGTSFDNVITNLRNKIEDKDKQNEFTKFIEDWFEHQKRQKKVNTPKMDSDEKGTKPKSEIKVTMTYPGPGGEERQHVIFCNQQTETSTFEQQNLAKIAIHNP